MKKYWKQYLSLALLVMLTGCKHEINVIVPEEVDANYSIRYYAKPPHSGENQGYFYNDGQERKFIQLASQSEPPYQLMVIVSDSKGQEVLDYMQQKEDGVILDVQHTNPDSDKKEKIYMVQATRYFECRSFYVSECYNGSTYVLPNITIKMKDGQDISPIEERYKGALTQGDLKFNGMFYYNCNQKTSYEVLMLTGEIYTTDGVEWAEANMTGHYETH